MMSLYLRSNRRSARKRLVLATAIVAALFILDVISGGTIRGLARSFSAVVWNAGVRIESAIFGSGLFSSRRALQTENDALKKKVAELEAEAAGVEALKSENAELREIVRLAEGVAGVTVPIISSVRSSPYGTFMIGAGSAEGITIGSVVLAGGRRGFVMGEVAEAGTHSSLVREIFAPGASVEAVAGSAVMNVEGQGGGNARAEVPRALSVAEGDPVTSAQFSGWLIGVVGSVSSNSASAYKTVYLRTPMDRSSLQFVYVIPSSQ